MPKALRSSHCSTDRFLGTHHAHSKSVKPYTLHPTPCPHEKLFAANPNQLTLILNSPGYWLLTPHLKEDF
ncbi:MAG: hypothetical protein LW716_11660 [Microcystis sp. 53602_E8]|nr:hypothetical protein [Microcystis sp. 53602_E8]